MLYASFLFKIPNETFKATLIKHHQQILPIRATFQCVLSSDLSLIQLTVGYFAGFFIWLAIVYAWVWLTQFHLEIIIRWIPTEILLQDGSSMLQSKAVFIQKRKCPIQKFASQPEIFYSVISPTLRIAITLPIHTMNENVW